MSFLTRHLAQFLVLPLALSGVLLAADDGYEPPSLVRLQAVGSMENLVEEALSSDWDVVARGAGWIDVMMPQGQAEDLERVERVRGLFQAQGNRTGPLRQGGAVSAIEVRMEDVDSQLAAFVGRDDAGAYHTYAEVQAEVTALVASHSDLIHTESIGKTFEGRDILAVRFAGLGDAEGRPSTLITGLHHAREWISVEVPMATIHMLAEGYGEDPWVTEMLDSRTVWIVPVVNPDGHFYSQTKKRMWRKNRAKNSWGSRGVDPNRNYGYKWGGTGASGSPWSDTYRGATAFSEPETQAIRDLALREEFVSSLSFHSYSQLVLWPWGYTYDDTPDQVVLAQHGTEMGRLTGYKPMKSSGLYRTSGDFCDWFYGATGALSYTFELGKQFVPPEAEIPAIVSKNLKAVRYFLEHTVTP